MSRPIAISLSPNTQAGDVLLAVQMLLSPWKWRSGSAIDRVARWFRENYGGEAFTFNSARSAEFELLQAAGIGKGDEVIVQAFTCVAVPNSVLWAGAKPVFVDCDANFNIDTKDLEKKITKKTKAILVQHTFGIPADIKKIQAIAKKHDLFLFEDCAHSLGATVDEEKVGTFGDAAFFSFGRDKVISSVFGGVLVVHKKTIAENLQKKYKTIHNPSVLWIMQQLLHPILFTLFILPLYTSGIGKGLLVVFQNIGLLSKAVMSEEKRSLKPSVFPKRLPNAQAELVLNQLQKLESFNNHRNSIVELYRKELNGISQVTLPSDIKGAIWLRFPVLTNSRSEILNYMKSKGIVLGDWYDVVTPKESLPYVDYQNGSCPTSEEYATGCINLPTYPTLRLDQAKEVINHIKRFYQ